jgi:hypothetical protein
MSGDDDLLLLGLTSALNRPRSSIVSGAMLDPAWGYAHPQARLCQPTSCMSSTEAIGR